MSVVVVVVVVVATLLGCQDAWMFGLFRAMENDCTLMLRLAVRGASLPPPHFNGGCRGPIPVGLLGSSPAVAWMPGCLDVWAFPCHEKRLHTNAEMALQRALTHPL